MKKLLSIFMTLALLSSIVVSTAACTTDMQPPDGHMVGEIYSELEYVNLVLASVEFAASFRTAPILAAINEILLREINATLEIIGVSQDFYNIKLTGIEGVDIITATDYLDYHANARAGAFMPIEIPYVQRLMPTWYADNAHMLSAAMVDGQLYAIYTSEPSINVPIFVLRGDLMRRHGIYEVTNLDELYHYFSIIRDNYPDMTPVAIDSGIATWLLGAMAFGATGLKAPGGPNSTSPVVMNKFDYPNFVLQQTYEQTELLEFFEYMKRFREAGFWNENVFANPIPMNEAFMSGTSGAAWTLNVRAINNLHVEMLSRLPEAELYIFDFGIAYGVPIDNFSPMGLAWGLPRTTRHYERALMFMELLYTNRELALLFNYGIEGEDYVIENGEINLLDAENRLGFPEFQPMTNRSIFMIPPIGGNHPDYERIMAEINVRFQLNPFAGFGFDATPVLEIDALLWDIHLEYVVPLYLGMVDDVPAAFAAAQEMFNNVNIRKYQQAVYDQLQEYIIKQGLEQYTVTMR